MIALAVSHPNAFPESYQDGVADFARRAGTERWSDVVMIPQPMLAAGSLRRYRLAGLMAFLATAEAVEDARSLGIPVVNLSASEVGRAFPTVTVDNPGIGAAAAGYFLERGYRHFAFAAGSIVLPFAAQRGLGFVRAVGSAGECAWFGTRPVDLPPNVRHEAGGSIAAWLRGLSMPAAVFCAHDELAAEVRLAAQAARLSVPQQVSILGVGNDPAARDRAGALSSIELPRRQVGYAAAATLDRLMDARPPRRAVLPIPPGQIVTRRSSDARAIADELVLETLELIDARARDRIDAGDIAAAIPLSRRALERRFLKVTGTTIKARIQQARITYARRLLTSTTLPIDEIAAACGFGDRNRFFVAFRQATAQSPTHYRHSTPTDVAPDEL